MSNLKYFIGLVLIIIGLNFHVINKELFYFGVFGSFAVVAFGWIITCNSIFQKIVTAACLIVLKMLMIGEIINHYGIKSELFNTTDYNYVFWIQLFYVLVISSLIGLYYVNKNKCR